MSTKTEDKASDQPIEAAPPAIVDDHAGVYGWFRRHQKKLLYSVGFFVLIFFSISGPMMASVSGIFDTPREMSTMTVGGKSVSLTPEDFDIGLQLANRARIMASVMPEISVGDGGRSELSEVYAWLRRVAIAEGLDVSLDEVDRALATMMEGGSVKSPTQLARQLGFASLAECRLQFAEAMRIGTLLRLQTLALDNSEASILDRVIDEREKITLRVATFDEKALDEKLKAAGGVSDEDLNTWLATKEETEKQRLGAFDTNRAALSIGALRFDEFDRADWAEEYLEGFEIGGEQRLKVYNVEKERFKNEDDTYREATAEDVIAELNVLIETERVMGELHRKLGTRRTESMAAAVEERTRNNDEFFTAQNEVTELEQRIQDNPEDEEAKAQLPDKKNVLTAKENAKKIADEAVDALYAAFDFQAAFKELTDGKKGVVSRAFAEPRKEEALKDLDAEDMGLGEWGAAKNATFHRKKGDFSFGPQRTTKVAMIYQVTAIDVNPLKPWEDLKPLVEGAYFTEQAKEQAEVAKDKLEAALLRLAKAKMPDKVSEIEGQRQTRIDEKVAAWEQKLNEDVAHANVKLGEARPGRKAHAAWQNELDKLQKQLEDKVAQTEAYAKEIDEAIEKEIGDEAMKLHKDVLDEAAAEAGFEVADIGPLSRDLVSKPRYAERYGETAAFLWREQSELEENEATGVLNDATNRRWHAAWCQKVEPLTYADVERREFEFLRKGYTGKQSYAWLQSSQAFRQAFTREALEKRYEIKAPAGKQTVDQPSDG